MSLINPALLMGLGLVAVPILLHLLMRVKPKRRVFPALRLLVQSRKQNSRRMQLRHLWLLILRCLVIGLLVVALARPSLPMANYSLTWIETAVLLVIVAGAAGTYLTMMSRWKKQQIPRHELLTRRSLLR
ncbi:MAG: hypothetical protein FJ267_05835, partial [Planctomycetes bacterium]|nr:hypothetical protein [Planctomycetota bacterium]